MARIYQNITRRLKITLGVEKRRSREAFTGLFFPRDLAPLFSLPSHWHWKRKVYASARKEEKYRVEERMRMARGRRRQAVAWLRQKARKERRRRMRRRRRKRLATVWLRRAKSSRLERASHRFVSAFLRKAYRPECVAASAYGASCYLSCKDAGNSRYLPVDAGQIEVGTWMERIYLKRLSEVKLGLLAVVEDGSQIVVRTFVVWPQPALQSGETKRVRRADEGAVLQLHQFSSEMRDAVTALKAN